MLEINFSLEGGEVVSRRLGIVADGVKSFQDPLERIGTNLMKVFDANFNSRGGLFGGWAPRKPQYRNGTRIDTWPLLEKTGRMRRAFQARANANTLLVSNPTPYFVYHQSKASRSHLPRRVMMKLRRQEADMIVKAFQAYVVEVLRRAGER